MILFTLLAPICFVILVLLFYKILLKSVKNIDENHLPIIAAYFIFSFLVLLGIFLLMLLMSFGSILSIILIVLLGGLIAIILPILGISGKVYGRENVLMQDIITFSYSGILIIPIIFVSYLLYDYYEERRVLEERNSKAQALHYIQLEAPMEYGEITIPKGSWLNRGGDYHYRMADLKDVRQGLMSIHFSEEVMIAGIPAIAINTNPFAIELAKDYEYLKEGIYTTCDAGRVLRFNMSKKDRAVFFNEISGNIIYQDFYGWFTPSQWDMSIGNCHDVTNGIGVLKRCSYGLMLARDSVECR